MALRAAVSSTERGLKPLTHFANPAGRGGPIPMRALLVLFVTLFISLKYDALVTSIRHALLAGTQKSGTTVLAAMLASQPAVLFAAHKELHFFDRAKNFNMGTDKYISHFENDDTTCPPPSVFEQVLMEATPFYVASRVACARIARTLPGTKLIILLREPIARAYSEYQMKLRRMAEQTSFMALLKLHSDQLHSCVQEHRGDYEAIRNCVPAALATHSRWTKLITAFKRAEAKVGKWSAVVSTCFRNVGEQCDPWDPHANAADDSSRAPVQNLVVSLNARSRESNDVLTHTRHTNLARKSTLAGKKAVYNVSAVPHQAADKCAASPAFDYSSCFQYYREGIETVMTVREAFMGEVADFQACASQYMANSTLDGVDDTPEGEHVLLPVASYSVLDCIGCRCPSYPIRRTASGM
jgi:hypothetical protein